MAIDLQLLPGFRFHPTDEELLLHYLCRKCVFQSTNFPIIAEIDLYKYDPWDLPGLALYGEKEWYFFTPRDRKYPNGSRPNRVAGCGYWKATGVDKSIGNPKVIGIKKSLVFYAGKAPTGEKTNWIMHEYRLANIDRTAQKKSNNLRLDDWVLCRIYNKKGTIEKHPLSIQKTSRPVEERFDTENDKKPPMMVSVPEISMAANNNYMYFDPINFIPKLHTDCSEHLESPEFSHSKCEVQSEPNISNWQRASLQFPFNYMDALMLDNNGNVPPGFDPQHEGNN